MTNEIKIMQCLKHPNIIEMLGVWEDEHFVYIAMPLCAGKELFDYVLERQKLSENKVSRFVCLDFGKLGS